MKSILNSKLENILENTNAIYSSTKLDKSNYTRSNKILSFFAYSILFGITLFNLNTLKSQNSNTNNFIPNKNFYEIVKEQNSYFDTMVNKKGSGYKPFKRAEYFWQQRISKDGNFPNLVDVYNDGNNWLNNSKAKNNKTQAATPWKFVGVNKVPEFKQGVGFTGIGRFNYIEFHPTNSNILWGASSGGGVWMTTNGGTNWKNFDETDFMSLGISCISVSKSNPNIVYAATGDANGPSGMGAYYSIGIYKTTNNGTSWSLMTSPIGGTLQQSNQFSIYAMEVNPTNPNLVYIATNVGVYVSQNGGGSWTQILSGFCRDLKMHPTNSNILYGAIRTGNSTFKISVYSVTSNTWTNDYAITNCVRTRFAVHKNFPNVVYAINVNQNNGFRSIVKSTDSGVSWTQTSASNSFNYLGIYITNNSSYGQGIYDLAIAISPRNESEIIIGGIHVWISNNSGSSFTPISNGYYEQINVEYVHPDHHFIGFNGNRLYDANDGGIVFSDNYGTNWTNITNGLGNTEHSRLSVSSTNGNLMLAGSQDNGTFLKGTNNWQIASGGDGMDNAIDPGNSNFMFTSSQNGSIFRSTNGGQSFDNIMSQNQAGEQAYWCAPMALDPINSSTLYVGYQNVWKSTNRGTNWTKISSLPTNANKTLTYIAVAPSNNQVIYTSFSDYSAPNFESRSYLYRTTNSGGTWELVYTSANLSITGIAVNSKAPTKAYISLSGYTSGQKVIELNGSVATNISANLPNLPVNVVVYQKDTPDRLYIGSDMGVFTRDANSSTWSIVGEGLPNVIVNDIEIHYGSGKLKAATYGRGVWELDLLNCSLSSPELYVIGNVSLCSGDSLVLETKSQYAGYEWSNGAKTRKLVVKESGDYFVTVSDDKGCKATSASYKVTVGTVTPVVLEYDKTKLNLCENDSLIVNAKGFYSKFEWSSGQSSRRITIKEPGEYFLVATSNTSTCKTTSEKLVVTKQNAPTKPTLEQVGNKLVASEGNNYNWYRNDTLLTSVITKEYEPTIAGNYKVSVSNSSGCESVRSESINYIPAGVENELIAKSLIIKPNPTNGLFDLELDNSELNFNLITITDINGSVVYENSISNSENNIMLNMDLTKFANGVYYLLLKNNSFTISKSIIKQ